MGYRSDIMVMTDLDDFEVMLEIADEIKEQYNLEGEHVLFPVLGQDPVDRFDEYEVNDEGIVYFGYDFVKWYDGYSDVDHFMKVLEVANEQGLSWQFIRLGEELGDYEEEYSDNFWDSNLPKFQMGVGQEITFE